MSSSVQDGLALEASLITSFATGGLHACMKNWPQNSGRTAPLENAELYAFMSADLRSLVNAAGVDIGGLSRQSNAVTVMSALFERANSVNFPAIARWVNGAMTYTGPGPQGRVRIRAVATFIPEITSADDRIAQRGSRALNFILRLVPYLRDFGHPISAVEIVVGGIVAKVGLPRSPSFEEVRAERQPVEEIARSLQRGLKGMSKDIIALDCPICLEMEPGPLYALNSLKSMEVFLDSLSYLEKAIDKHFCMAANIDIGHMLVSRQELDLAKRISLSSRIGHGHISDHGIGHLSDAVIGTIRPDHEFLPWIQLLRSRIGKTDNCVKFSGVLSVECECACCPDCVQNSVDQVSKLLSIA